MKPAGLCRYRLLQRSDGQYDIRWLCGDWWLLVFGPGPEDKARAYLDFLVNMPL